MCSPWSGVWPLPSRLQVIFELLREGTDDRVVPAPARREPRDHLNSRAHLLDPRTLVGTKDGKSAGSEAPRRLACGHGALTVAAGASDQSQTSVSNANRAPAVSQQPVHNREGRVCRELEPPDRRPRL